MSMMRRIREPHHWPRPARTGQFEAIALAFLLVSAIVLGGGDNATFLAILHFGTLAIAAWAVWAWKMAPQPSPVPAKAVVVVLLIMALPLVQLVPLPPGIWRTLPGRQSGVEALRLIGSQDSWQPLTISKSRTIWAVLNLGPPLLIFVLVTALPGHKRWIAPATIAAAGVFSCLVGVIQIAGPPQNALRLYAPDSTWLQGFEASHNSQADLLNISLVAVAATATTALALNWLNRLQAFCIVGVLGAMLTLGVVLTASRAGMALWFVAMVYVSTILKPADLTRASPAKPLIAGAIAGGLTLAIWLALSFNHVIAVTSRFDLRGEKRPEIWQDSIVALIHSWPIGSGLGTFVQAFSPHERVEALYKFPVEHAHNEYLELLIEGGLPGVVVLLLVLATLATGLRKRWAHNDCVQKNTHLFALASLTIIALHAMIDYPLGAMSLACLMAASGGLLVQPVKHRSTSI